MWAMAMAMLAMAMLAMAVTRAPVLQLQACRTAGGVVACGALAGKLCLLRSATFVPRVNFRALSVGEGEAVGYALGPHGRSGIGIECRTVDLIHGYGYSGTHGQSTFTATD